MKSHSARDMLRQEAKLSEMSEEIRRRDLREQGPSRPLNHMAVNPGNPHMGMNNHIGHPPAAQLGPNGPHMGTNGPHMGTNGPHMGINGPHIGPNGPHMGPTNPHLSQSQPHIAGTPPGKHPYGKMGGGIERESPPPPPPPPTSTHPLYTRESNR